MYIIRIGRIMSSLLFLENCTLDRKCTVVSWLSLAELLPVI